jgi:hypothetical protein
MSAGFREVWGTLAAAGADWKELLLAFCSAEADREAILVAWLNGPDVQQEPAALAVLLLALAPEYGGHRTPAVVDVLIHLVFDQAPSRLAWAFLGLAAYTLHSTSAQAALRAKSSCFDLTLMAEVHRQVHAYLRDASSCPFEHEAETARSHTLDDVPARLA